MTLKERIQNKEKLIGTILASAGLPEGIIMGRAGYDVIWIDMEHSPIEISQLLPLILAIKSGGASVIVRVPQNELTYTKKVLEMGVDGIIFPLIRTAQEAKECIDNTLYPPYGTRGYWPQYAIGYGYDDAMQYIADTKNHLCRFIQIEHVDAVENLDELMQNEDIDGYILGPCDLSGSIGELNHVFEPNTIALLEKCIKKLHDAGKYVGLAGGCAEDVMERWSALGVDLLVAGNNFDFLRNHALKTKNDLIRIHKTRG